MEGRKASSTPCHLETGWEKGFEDLCSKVGKDLEERLAPRASVWEAGPPPAVLPAGRVAQETPRLLDLGQIRVKEIWECVLWSHM